ncbi:MAG: hypothetical protein J5957_04410 [Prevotella sp.]|nr:hypothetical protein [Prevotella sp.]MBQ9223377.1 hypothetical protein [Prevotella sp.]
MKKIMFLLLMLNISMISFAQGVYTFLVLDGSGDPVIGAAVIVKGVNTGSVTDRNGLAIIVTAIPNPQFEISHIGMMTETVISEKGKFRYEVILCEVSEVYHSYPPIFVPWKPIISYNPWIRNQMV